VDGVILRDGPHRSTFLPQVWEKIPNPAQFLDHLCMKMGADENLWRYQLLDVYTYQVEEFQDTLP
jgi:AMMECR1 domain-containing protein